ncbi:unnamed protein product [Arabidopsis thaliana]|uniref:F-box domain-containing protein n=1 Tax=Arabidopsis thaliana TaxID=3702 RepID=A0A654F9M4_ARATH|nr:unnamed protein product [Arabidopsis thaliana]
MADDSATPGVRVPSHRYGRHYHRRKIKEAVDSISSLPDVILQHILSFIPTKLAITTSLLSKRWRHVWCDTPSLSFNDYRLEAPFIDETVTRYTASKMMRFHLHTSLINNVPHLESWIKFAMSRNVDHLSLDLWNQVANKFKFPDFFHINSSLKQLTVVLDFSDTMIAICSSVSWTSLKKLYLSSCLLSDESMANILSGCPILESLTLDHCGGLRVLDLSKSLRLRTLEINCNIWVPELTAMQIVVPHTHCLRLRNSKLPCSLVDVSSLKEAKLNICIDSFSKTIKADFLQVTLLKMLEKLHNVEKLTLGGNFLQILSVAELRGVPFPMFKVKDLTLETVIFQYVIPGIERVLQNSPDLKKLTLLTKDFYHKPGEYLGDHMDLQGFNLDQCWKSKYGVFWNKSCLDVESEHVVSFVELMLKNTKALDKMVVLLEDHYVRFKEMVPRLSHNYNISIALYTFKPQS